MTGPTTLDKAVARVRALPGKLTADELHDIDAMALETVLAALPTPEERLGDLRAAQDAAMKRTLLSLATHFDAMAVEYRDDAAAYSYEAGIHRTWTRAAEYCRRIVRGEIDITGGASHG